MNFLTYIMPVGNIIIIQPYYLMNATEVLQLWVLGGIHYHKFSRG